MRLQSPFSAVVLAALAAGCSTAGPAAAPTEASGAPVRLTASLVQYREDAVAHLLRVRVGNSGTVAVTVRALRLAWPGLAEQPPAAMDAALAPGQLFALPIPYGAAACERGAIPREPGAAVASVLPEGRAEQEVRVELVDSADLLGQLYSDECRRRALAEKVDVQFGTFGVPGSAGGRPTLRGTVVVRRRGTQEPITVTATDGSVLLALRPAAPVGTPPLRLAPGTASGTLAVEVTSSGRCDGHALGESKKTYVFSVLVSVGIAAAEDVTITPDAPARAKMLAVIERACGIPRG